MDLPPPSSPSAAGATFQSPPSFRRKIASSTATASPAAGEKAAKKLAMVSGMLPAGKPVAVPRSPKPPRKAPAIPLATAIAAATRNGGLVLDVSAMKKDALLGKFIEQSGARDLGRYRIAVSASRIDDIDRVLVELDGKAQAMAGDASLLTRLAIQKTRIEAVEVGTRVGMALLETEEAPELQGVRPPVMPGFGSAIQINLGQGATATTTATTTAAPEPPIIPPPPV